MDMVRCPWCEGDELYTAYHDTEWGVPLYDDHKLFELLILEGAQAGLSWITILRRREGYRAAFNGFDVQKIARYGTKDLERLMGDPRIIRNRRKILSAKENARAFLALQKEAGSFSAWLWKHVDGKPVDNYPKTMGDIPALTPLSQTISKELKQLGFTFVGPTIMYAYLQSAGLVNDHLADCFTRKRIRQTVRSRVSSRQ
ncbi:MAG: DNA-3-methyladenine glycosylase I [Spirochaetaceae bacterium]|jgi:DNA-3-methyladenine glycosylase I|nr:DNA-3-methyladenine glycosylase I [Spirochaetaceae bacterium]